MLLIQFHHRELATWLTQGNVKLSIFVSIEMMRKTIECRVKQQSGEIIERRSLYKKNNL